MHSNRGHKINICADTGKCEIVSSASQRSIKHKYRQILKANIKGNIKKRNNEPVSQWNAPLLVISKKVDASEKSKLSERLPEV